MWGLDVAPILGEDGLEDTGRLLQASRLLQEVVLGTRAYAVREDIVTHNRRLLEYVERGGHLIVLYNAPEFRPAGLAPYPGELPEDAEQVSKEDAPRF